jgi:hypothetical protein
VSTLAGRSKAEKDVDLQPIWRRMSITVVRGNRKARSPVQNVLLEEKDAQIVVDKESNEEPSSLSPERGLIPQIDIYAAKPANQ